MTEQKKDKISVSDYAKIKAISKQRVYQLLNNSLNKYLKIENGKKYILISALSEEERKRYFNELEQGFNKNLNKVEQGVEQGFLLEQIQKKDEQIAQLTEQLKESQNQNTELIKLLNQTHVLIAREQEQKLLPENTQPTENTNEESKPKEEHKRRGFFRFWK